mgnify:CR=1 FL=1
MFVPGGARLAGDSASEPKRGPSDRFVLDRFVLVVATGFP